jgi:hypothetical protein
VVGSNHLTFNNLVYLELHGNTLVGAGKWIGTSRIEGAKTLALHNMDMYWEEFSGVLEKGMPDVLQLSHVGIGICNAAPVPNWIPDKILVTAPPDVDIQRSYIRYLPLAWLLGLASVLKHLVIGENVHMPGNALRGVTFPLLCSIEFDRGSRHSSWPMDMSTWRKDYPCLLSCPLVPGTRSK